MPGDGEIIERAINDFQKVQAHMMIARKENATGTYASLKNDYQKVLDEQKKEVRELVMAGLEQIKEGKTKDFNTVCDRLEKKYKDEAISN